MGTIKGGIMQTVYQKLYNDETLHYGDADHKRCPSVRYLPNFSHWIKSPVIELGCGRGQLVELLRKQNIAADGMDFIKCNAGMMVVDISQPIDLSMYRSSICIDVFEHLNDQQVIQVLKNMQATTIQVINTHSGPARERGSIDLHINKKTSEEWASLISQYLKIKKTDILGKYRTLFLCEA
jgi:hypothetical protein